MKAAVLIFAGGVSRWAFEPLVEGKSAFHLTLEKASRFPHVTNITVLASENENLKSEIKNLKAALVPVQIVKASAWNTKNFLHELSRASEGYDFSYFLWADCPFIDGALAAEMQKRHEVYPAEYTYADGWPYGLAPEIFSPGTLGILASLAGGTGNSAAGGAENPVTGGAENLVKRDTLFSVLQKDINSFDIETEIAPADLRVHRITLCADTKRNFLLLSRFLEAGYKDFHDAEPIILNNKHLFRTLPAFFNIQITSGCPQKCAFCPYPLYKNSNTQNEFIDVSKFDTLISNIAEFTDDAVIDISLWGEAALHPEIEAIARSVLKHAGLSLVIETTGLGWKGETLEKLAETASRLPQRRACALPALTWIVSLDSPGAEYYAAMRSSAPDGAPSGADDDAPSGGGGEAEADFARALSCTEKLFTLFPGAVYVQAVRVEGSEDIIEQFYKQWKTKTNNIIIQKYDNFCGKLPPRLATDISPVVREPCWHLMRDMYILLDGSVPVCKEDICAVRGKSEFPLLGNVFTENPAEVWDRGTDWYREHCTQCGKKTWSGLCAKCDEYYTFNF